MGWFVPAADGRTLAVEGAGDPAGRCCCTPAWFFEDEGHGLRDKHIADIHGWFIDHGA